MATKAISPPESRLSVDSVFPGGCTVRLNADERHLRPGNTVSGPSLFTLADIGGYACVLSHAGPDALSVTTNLNINFMRKAGRGPVDGRCRILKLGRSLMVFDIDIVGGDYVARNIACLNRDGRLVNIAFRKGSKVELDR